MRSFAICLLLILAPLTVSAESYLGIEEGSSDLQRNEALAKPFTVLDQLLYSLKLESLKVSEFIRPDKDDFRLKYPSPPSVHVVYSRELQRVGVQFTLSVQGMDDPWQQVCERHIRRVADFLVLKHAGSTWDKSGPDSRDSRSARRVFLQNLLGQDLVEDEAKVSSLQPFIDAISLIGIFNVSKDAKLSFSRHCALDIRNNRMTYFEHKY